MNARTMAVALAMVMLSISVLASVTATDTASGDIGSYMDITFDPNGGTGEPEIYPIYIQHDSEGISMTGTVPTALPEMDGKMCVGWSVENDGTVDFLPGEVLEWSNRVEVDETYTVYAIWGEIADLGFDTDPTGGTIAYAS